MAVATTAPTADLARKTATRNISVDAYRGFVMFLMMAEVLRFAKVAADHPGNWFWSLLAFHQTHAEWVGCSLHDTIQPSFSFLVGVALPYSIASRMAKGASFHSLFLHALWRSFLLAFLGIFLRSLHSPIFNFTFEDTLTQIGLGYPILFLLGWLSPRWQWSAFGTIVVGYWLAWMLYPVPDHFAKNANLGWAFDVWFLNLFPRVKPFEANSGGYLTLSFIPTLATMILGLVAGRWLKASSPKIPVKRLLIAGAIGIAVGLLVHALGICPIVKRIWTPAWVLFSGGICFLFLAGFSYLKWTFPLAVIGMNSIAAYCMAHLFEGFFAHSLKLFGVPATPPIQGLAILACYWLILYWMYKRKIFLRI